MENLCSVHMTPNLCAKLLHLTLLLKSNQEPESKHSEFYMYFKTYFFKEANKKKNLILDLQRGKKFHNNLNEFPGHVVRFPLIII